MTFFSTQNNIYDKYNDRIEAFWNVYKPGCDEHLMVHQIRKSKDFIAELDFVAESEGMIVGSVLCSECNVVDENGKENHESIIVIGPIGVIPSYQGRGVGSMLMEQVKKTASEMGKSGIILYGNPKYYH